MLADFIREQIRRSKIGMERRKSQRHWVRSVAAIAEGVWLGFLSLWAIYASPESARTYVLTGMVATGVLSMLVSVELQRRAMKQLSIDLERMHEIDHEMTRKFLTDLAKQYAEEHIGPDGKLSH